MNKNAFSLTECVVSIGLVVLMSIIIASGSLVAISITNKNVAINFVLNEVENIAKIIEKVKIEDATGYSDLELNNALYNYNGKAYNLKYENIKNTETINIKYDKSGEENINGCICINYKFYIDNDFFAFGVESFYNDKSIFSNENVFEKYVSNWGLTHE